MQNKILKIIFHTLFWVTWIWFFSKVTIIDESIEIKKIIVNPGEISTENYIGDPLNTLLINSLGVFIKLIFSYFVIFILNSLKKEKVNLYFLC